MKAVFNEAGDCLYLGDGIGVDGQPVPANLEGIDSSRLRLVDGEIVVADVPSLPIDVVKASARAKIDSDAETARLKYVTPGAAQALTYQEKVRQAQAFQADGAPDETKYPMIYGEVGITADADAGPAGVAAVILQSFAQWQQIGAAIERVRLTTKKAIAEATNADGVNAIVLAVVWP